MREVFLKIRGRVQGVGFRRWAVLQAKSIGGVSGWIRNAEDGSVELLMRGNKENIEEIILILYYMFDFIRGEEQKMLKNTIMWTVITAILTALVYVELAVSGLMYVNIFTAISAIISIIVSVKEKKYIYILINIVLMFIALISYIVMY